MADRTSSRQATGSAQTLDRATQPGWGASRSPRRPVGLPAEDASLAADFDLAHREARQPFWEQPSPGEGLSTSHGTRPKPQQLVADRHDFVPEVADLADPKLQALLQRPIDRIIWPDIPWPDAVEFLRGETGVNIVVAAEPLAQQGFSPDRRIRLEGSTLTLAAALDALVHLIGPGDFGRTPVWRVVGNAIVITAPDSADSASQ